jgi:hypothetical protein
MHHLQIITMHPQGICTLLWFTLASPLPKHPRIKDESYAKLATIVALLRATQRDIKGLPVVISWAILVFKIW